MWQFQFLYNRDLKRTLDQLNYHMNNTRVLTRLYLTDENNMSRNILISNHYFVLNALRMFLLELYYNYNILFFYF